MHRAALFFFAAVTKETIQEFDRVNSTRISGGGGGCEGRLRHSAQRIRKHPCQILARALLKRSPYIIRGLAVLLRSILQEMPGSYSCAPPPVTTDMTPASTLAAAPGNYKHCVRSKSPGSL